MRSRYLRPIGLLALVLLVVSLVATVSAAGESVIDFEGLSDGEIVSSVSSGSGISGEAVSGSVIVFGDSANPAIAGNAAIVFNAGCTPAVDCTGGDDDLSKPELGKVLIIGEDLVDTSPADGLVDDPDDADLEGADYKFDYSGWGSGSVTVHSISVLDVESTEQGGARIELYSGGEGGTLVTTVAIPATGDNGLATVNVDASGIDFMTVTLNGSGAIDNIRISPELPDPTPTPPAGGEGCTPGYWKQEHHFGSWVTYAPGDSFDTVFGVDSSFTTLLDAVSANGGGENALGRHAVAALLNAATDDVDSSFTTADVIQMVQDAYASGDFEGVKNIFEADNEAGCPLGRAELETQTQTSNSGPGNSGKGKNK